MCEILVAFLNESLFLMDQSQVGTFSQSFEVDFLSEMIVWKEMVLLNQASTFLLEIYLIQIHLVYWNFQNAVSTWLTHQILLGVS